MRWFKHFTDNHRGRSVQSLMDEMGHSGLCYFILMEMCAEKLERPNNLADHQQMSGSLTADDCEFIFHRRVVESAVRLRRAAVERLLSCCQTSNLFTYEINGEFIKIKMPILLDLLDYDSKRSRSRRAEVGKKSRIDKDTDKEEETESDTETDYSEKSFKTDAATAKKQKPKKEKTPVAVDNKASALVAHYCDEFKFKYSVNPSISRADAGTLKKLFQDMGLEKAKDLIRAYFEMPEPYIVKSKHPIKLLSYKINEVLVYAETGKFTTTAQVRSVEKAQKTQSLFEEIAKGNV